jgi:mannobiose 2-epimerase
VSRAPSRRRLLGWRNRFRKHLIDDILGFWLKHDLDDKGGFHGALDRAGNPKPGAKQSLVLIARILWTFSAAARKFGNPRSGGATAKERSCARAYRAAAHRAFRVLMSRFYDRRYGGWYWTLDAKGRVIDGHKYLYGISYVIYGLAEYGLMTRDGKVLDLALRAFRQLDAVGHDRARGGYHEAFRRNWTRERGHYPIGPATQKSANTHLHLLEAYTLLLRATGDPLVRARLEELRALFITRFANPAGYTHEFMTADWKPVTFDSSYGHDVELAWLIHEATIALGYPADDPPAVRVACEQIDHALKYGYDRSRGGFYERGPGLGRATKRSMNWWSQTEGLVGLLAVYQMTGKPAYFARFEKTAKFVFDKFVDHEYGEWWSYLDARGRVTRTMKVTPWKCPYHNGRACLEIMRRMEALARG